MGKSLFIAEKPSVAAEFAKALKENTKRGDGYLESENAVVTWCVGHLVTMSYPECYDEKLKKWNIQEIHDRAGLVVFHTTGRKDALDSGMRYRKQTVAMGLPSLSEYEIWQTDEEEFRACAEIVHSFAGAGA